MLSVLKGAVFHLTTQASYKSILKDGMIYNNKDGRFDIKKSLSQNSFGRLAGYVCLFDLRDKDDDAIEDILNKKYPFLGPPWFRQPKQPCDDYDEWNLAYLILSPKYYEKLIPYEKSIKYFNVSDVWQQVIPHAETWISDHIPLEWISIVYLVRIRERLPAYGNVTLIREIIEANRRTLTNSSKMIR
ncbi:MAG TPA: hypothetical protein ACFYD7_10020 [Candidatus Wujingus californicus]|uniref:hypothetical protein n=1 Tax=Candidatus Wujingus californicus TaxID=3367618 RepID=UPI001DA8A6BB|nr:hypothetical protein [Planctomycetota bacterium]